MNKSDFGLYDHVAWRDGPVERCGTVIVANAEIAWIYEHGGPYSRRLVNKLKLVRINKLCIGDKPTCGKLRYVLSDEKCVIELVGGELVTLDPEGYRVGTIGHLRASIHGGMTRVEYERVHARAVAVVAPTQWSEHVHACVRDSVCCGEISEASAYLRGWLPSKLDAPR